MKIDWNRYKRDIQHAGCVLDYRALPQPDIDLLIFPHSEKDMFQWVNHPIWVNTCKLTYTFPDDKDIYLVGDLHGNYKRFKEAFVENDYKDCIFIMLGDQVMLYEDSWKQYRKLDNMLRDRNCQAYFIRGNHDCAYYHTQEYYAMHFTNIFPLNMGIIKYRGKQGFIFGGAISLNRGLMKEGINFWKQFDYIDPWKDEYRDYQFDFIISHTGPIPHGIVFNNNCEKFLISDKELRGDLEREQNELRDMMCHYTPKLWCFGHYHMDKEYKIVPFENDDYECQCNMVDVNSILNFTEKLKNV